MKKFSVQTSEYIDKGAFWKKKVVQFLKDNISDVSITNRNPDVVIILGGDGTIIDKVMEFEKYNPLFFGLNLGNVGFLASVRKENEFLEGIHSLIKGEFETSTRMLLEAKVLSNKKVIAVHRAFNEVVVRHVAGVVDLSLSLGSQEIRSLKGDGVIIASPSGSTAYNFSAGGPIIDPKIESLIITSMMDLKGRKNSLVISPNNAVSIRVNSFRENRDSINKDVILTIDGKAQESLSMFDEVCVKKHSRAIRIAELITNKENENYFFASAKEKLD
ncbi:MAG: NAD(+)/NADH kinase [Candidatus Pacebacteria bacterium]|nr:NAD(+)/NADH kinase [Candidatus Paceibacterota bacterium]